MSDQPAGIRKDDLG